MIVLCGLRRGFAGLCEEAAGAGEVALDKAGEDVTALLARLRSIEVVSTPGEGLGEELQGQAEQTHLAALVAQLEDDADADVLTVHLRVSQLPVETAGDAVGRSPEPRVRERGRRVSRVRVTEQVRRLQSALARPSVPVGGPCLVVSMPVFERFVRLRCLPAGLPLPHRSGGNLVIWRNPSMYPLLELAELLTDRGLPTSAVWSWNGDHDRLNDLPNWLEVVSVRRNRVELRGTDS